VYLHPTVSTATNPYSKGLLHVLVEGGTASVDASQ
jgi:hypothetical protein